MCNFETTLIGTAVEMGKISVSRLLLKNKKWIKENFKPHKQYHKISDMMFTLVTLSKDANCNCSMFTSFFARMDEDKNLVAASVFHHFLVHYVVHHLETLESFFLCDSDILLLQRHGSETVVKVEQTLQHKQNTNYIYVFLCKLVYLM